MPVFHNDRKNIYALVSYKVLYSQFCGSKNWREIGLSPTPRIYARSILRDHSEKTLFVVRAPYARVISCFMDKFRKQPARIHEPGFEWQACHKLMYPFCNLSDESRDTDIAQRFLEFSFDDFLDVLPNVYKFDGHYHPQSWSRKFLVGNTRLLSWPGCRILTVEDADSLSQIPDIDFSVRTNATGHIQRDFEITEKHKKVIRSLYHEDFKLGNYTA